MTGFWLARADEDACEVCSGTCTEYEAREALIQAIIAEEICPTQILQIVVGISADDRTEEIARAIALDWANKIDDGLLEVICAPAFVLENLKPAELDTIVAVEIQHRKDETEHREEISSPERTGRI